MTTYSEAVEQTITAGEQIHQIVNGTATTEVTVEDGSKVPSVRKALLDNFYFKDPIAWQVGQTENVFNQLRKFTDGSWWYAPSATASNPISMGATPVGNNNWKVYSLDAVVKLTPQLREALRRSYAEAGYNLVNGSFESGGVLSSENDVLLSESSGKAFSGTGPFPQIVPAGTSTSGFIDRSNITEVSVYSTVSEVATGNFPVGKTITLTDRAGGVFEVVSGGVPDGFGTLYAGSGKTAVLVDSHREYVRCYGDFSVADATAALAAALAAGASNFVGLSSIYLNGVTFPSREYRLCGAKLFRVVGYTGTATCITFADDCSIIGKFYFEESALAGSSSPTTVVNSVIFGNNFVAGDVVLTKTTRGSAIVYGGKINGNFHAEKMATSNLDYAGCRALVTVNTDIIHIGSYSSVNCGVKGFSVNGVDGDVKTIGLINIGTYESSTDSVNSATDGFLVDTFTDKTIKNVKRVIIGNIKVSGALSNCVKVENTETLVIKSAELPTAGANVNRTSLNTSVTNLELGVINYDGQLRTNAPNITIDSLNLTVTTGYSNCFPLRITTTPAGGVSRFTINSLRVIGDPVATGAIRLDDTVGNVSGRIGYYETSTGLKLLTYAAFDTTGKVGMIQLASWSGITNASQAPSAARSVLIRYAGEYKAAAAPIFGNFKRGDLVRVFDPSIGSPSGYIAVADIPDAAVSNANFRPIDVLS